ncbi:MAG TPA: hypothetical protein VGF07_02395, partial [Stellaceae bacterium]
MAGASASARDPRKPLRLGLLYAICGAVVLSPLLCARVPPLVDYPNHLARAWILVHRAQIPALAANYIVQWRVLPDLAMDFVVSALAHIVPVEQAGRIFVALTMAVLVVGTASLHRALHGQVGIWPLCSLLFLYNAALFWGFVSCLFATGVCLIVFSGWIATRHWRPGVRLPIFATAAGILFLLHLFAFGLYALLMVSYELGIRLGERRFSLRSLIGWLAVWLQLVPGILLWRVSLSDAGSTLVEYGRFADKLYALVSPFDFGVTPAPFDWLVAALISAGLVLALLTRSIGLAPRMRLPLAALAAAAVLMPHRASGAWGADLRLPVTLPFVIIASTRIEVSRRWAAAMAGLAGAAVLALRVGSVAQSWRDYDRWFTEFRAASSVISPGSRLLVAAVPAILDHRLPGAPAFFAHFEPVVFTHMAALAVIDRAAFFPYLFTGWTTVAVTPGNLPIAQREGQPARLADLASAALPTAKPNAIGELPYWRDWRTNFDVALV